MIRFVSSRFFLTFLFGLVVSVNSAAAGFISYDGHWYGYTSSASDWQSAESEAQSLGGHLVAINTAAEQQFIESTLLVGAYEHVPLWIGLTDQAAEGNFMWTTGESLAPARSWPWED